MAILGKIISRSLNIRNRLSKKVASPITYQMKTLYSLLDRGQYTSFGKHYEFHKILSESLNFSDAFRKRVPARNYNAMHDDWWHRCLEGEENVCWPGKVRYFALSSGTSESASKHIPVTHDMIRSIKKVGFKQFYSMVNFGIPSQTFTKGILMLGGSTSLASRGDYYEGDMSGISAKNMPRIISNLLYKPGQRISKTPSWEKRIKLIVDNAPKWDVGTLCGVPAWAQIVIEQIIEKHKVKNIHEIWPNLEIYIHGGVSFEPYKDSFSKLLGKPITFIETYMASEGSFGFQARPNAEGIKLVLNVDIFYEFVPFNEENFDDEGNMVEFPQSYLINEVDDKTNYAVLLTTCAGAWRYLIGDVVRFTDVLEHEIIIVGRTKQFLSMCGEHTSVDNLNKAIENVNVKLNTSIREFAVAGIAHDNLFAHHWFVGCDDKNIIAESIREIVDNTLCEINDDYAVERASALKEVLVTILPSSVFTDYMKSLGKYGAMNKFPRVLKGTQLESWISFLKSQNYLK